MVVCCTADVFIANLSASITFSDIAAGTHTINGSDPTPTGYSLTPTSRWVASLMRSPTSFEKCGAKSVLSHRGQCQYRQTVKPTQAILEAPCPVSLSDDVG